MNNNWEIIIIKKYKKNKNICKITYKIIYKINKINIFIIKEYK
jgi:hypothetical protein